MSSNLKALKQLCAGRTPASLLGDLRAAQARKSLAKFCQFADPTYQLARHNLKLIEALERVERGEIRRLAVSMPPRHSKSETSTINFPAWYLGRHPGRDVIIAANSATLAETFSRKAREKFREYAPPVWGLALSEESSAAGRWGIARRKGGLIAKGVGAALPGLGAHLLVIDDPFENAKAAYSDLHRRSVLEWYRADARTRLAPKGAVVVVATRYHEEDLIGSLIATERAGGEEWTVINMPMVSPQGRLLWPERFGADYGCDESGRPDPDKLAQAILAFGTSGWESLFQGRPSPESGNILKKEWWKRYRDPPPVVEHRAISLDATFNDTKGSDFVVFQVWDRVRANRYLRCQVRGRMDYVKTRDTLKRLVATWNPHEVVIEAAANGPAVISELRGLIGGLIAVKATESKPARARAVSPQIEAGNVWIPESSQGWEGPTADGDPVEAFILECAAFPNGRHDDQVDAMTQVLNRWRPNAGAEVTTLPPRRAARGLEV